MERHEYNHCRVFNESYTSPTLRRDGDVRDFVPPKAIIKEIIPYVCPHWKNSNRNEKRLEVIYRIEGREQEFSTDLSATNKHYCGVSFGGVNGKEEKRTKRGPKTSLCEM